jgi:hypothetical protein
MKEGEASERLSSPCPDLLPKHCLNWKLKTSSIALNRESYHFLTFQQLWLRQEGSSARDKLRICTWVRVGLGIFLSHLNRALSTCLHRHQSLIIYGLQSQENTQTWWHTPVIPSLRSLRQENHVLEVILGMHSETLSLKQDKTKQQQKRTQRLSFSFFPAILEDSLFFQWSYGHYLWTIVTILDPWPPPFLSYD